MNCQVSPSGTYFSVTDVSLNMDLTTRLISEFAPWKVVLLSEKIVAGSPLLEMNRSNAARKALDE